MNRLMHLNPIKVTFFLIAGIIITIGIYLYWHVLSFVLAALIFAHILNPIIYFMEKQRVNRILAISIIFTVLAGVLLWGLYYLAPLLFRQITGVALAVREFMATRSGDFDGGHYPIIREINAIIENLRDKYHVDLEPVKMAIDTYFKGLHEKTLEYFQKAMAFVTFIVTVPIIGFLILKDKDRIKRYLLSLIPNRYFEVTVILMEKIDDIVGNYLRGLMLEILIVSVLAFVALEIIGIKYALVIGIIAGLTNAIPYFGPMLGLLAASGSVLLTGGTLTTIFWVAIAMTVVQAVDNYLVYPVIMGKNAELPPLVIMLTVIAGGFAFGMLGMFLSVPLLILARGTIIVLHKSLREFKII